MAIPFRVIFQATASSSAPPRAETRFVTERQAPRVRAQPRRIRSRISAVLRSGSRGMIRSPKGFGQFICAAARLRTWEPAHVFPSALPRWRVARRISYRAHAAGPSSFHARRLRRIGMPASAPSSRVGPGRRAIAGARGLRQAADLTHWISAVNPPHRSVQQGRVGRPGPTSGVAVLRPVAVVSSPVIRRGRADYPQISWAPHQLSTINCFTGARTGPTICCRGVADLRRPL